MDLGDKKNSVLEEKNMDHNLPSFTSEWKSGYANISTQPLGSSPINNSIDLRRGNLVGSSASSVSMVNSFCPTLWDHPNPQNLEYCKNNFGNILGSSSASVGIDKSLETDCNYSNPTMRAGGFMQPGPEMIPQSLSQFPADSAFIERAARFSCFNAVNLSEVFNPYGNSESRSLYSKSIGQIQRPEVVSSGNRLEERFQKDVLNDISLFVDNGAAKGSLFKNDEANQATGLTNEADEAELNGSRSQEESPSMVDGGEEPSSVKGVLTKKRKRVVQNSKQAKGTSPLPGESVKDIAATKEIGDPNPSSSTGKANGKNIEDSSQAVDAPKEDYVHIRARRGQATNSHSLAERVRREKIGERMKFLQELVPGCDKITGKAVMLDEIINYVQSLQRQVEFLSMKLAAVNPRSEFNVESLLAKEMLHSRNGPSKMGFSPDMLISHPQLHPSQQGTIQAGISGLGGPSEMLRRTNNSDFTALGVGYKDLTPQMPNVWNDELQNVMMNLGANSSFHSQDQGDKHRS